MIEEAFTELQARLAANAVLGLAETNAATDFAIDANAAGRADLSIALLEPLSQRAPRTAKIWQLLGLALRDLQQMEKALDAFDRAAALEPGDPRIALGKAQTAFEAGRPAASLFKPLRAIAPDDGELALSAAGALLQEAKASTAENILTDMLAKHPNWLRGQDALAKMRWTRGDVEGYTSGYKQAAAVLSNDLDLYLAWYRAEAQIGNWEAAGAVVAQARKAIGDSVSLQAAEANIASALGDNARAEKLYQQVQGLNDGGTQISYIRHCLRSGHIERAKDIATPLLSQPISSMVWPYMSLIWRLLGDSKAEWLDGNPPFIRYYDLPIGPGELSQLADYIRTLHLESQHPAEQSLRGGTQTQGHLFLRLEPEIVHIKNLISDAVNEYIAALPAYDEKHPLLGCPRQHWLFEGAWSVRLQAQGFHVVHTHSHGWISSAFYVALPENMGAERAGWLQLGAPPPDLNIDLPAYAMIEPKPGRLALFPSTMWHGTIPFDDGERLTIAFDVRRPAY